MSAFLRGLLVLSLVTGLAAHATENICDPMAKLSSPGPEADSNTVSLRMSNPDVKGTLLRWLWGSHTLFEAMRPASVDINEFLPTTLKEFPPGKPNPNPGLKDKAKGAFTFLKKNVLFSPFVVNRIRKSLVNNYITDDAGVAPVDGKKPNLPVGEKTPREVHNWLPTHTEAKPAKFNMVITKDRVVIAGLTVKVKRVDWLLTKHVLMSGYDPDVRFAGEVWKDENGVIHINNNSGTYRPSNESVDAAVAYLSKLLPGVKIVGEGMPPSPPKPPKDKGSIFAPLVDAYQTLKGLDFAYLAQLKMIKEIKATTPEPKMARVKLSELTAIHPMNGVKENKVKARAKVVKDASARVLEAGFFSSDLQNELVPSKAPMSVVKAADGKYFLFDGNGRFKSIKRALAENPDLEIEVQLYDTPSEKVQTMLNSIRKSRGLDE